jgi:uncharacterized iron-regulated protein
MNCRLAVIVLLATATALAGCASRGAGPARDVGALLPADAVLLGEQHDAREHQRIHSEVVQALAARGALAGVAVEMAERGTSTRGLPADASEADARLALRWADQAWPWTAYGPAVMAAVRAGVPVYGANLPRADMRAAMAKTEIDLLLPPEALTQQMAAIRTGHCGLLPETQIAPMTRIQLARDTAMAQTLVEAAVPGKTVVLLAGSGHVDRRLGVPQHLPRGWTARAVRLFAGKAPDTEAASFDTVWTTAALPPKDHCAELREKMPARKPA